MNFLKPSASVLSVLFALGTMQAANAASTQPIVSTMSQDNLILVKGHGHGHGHGGHHGGRHGHHGGHDGHSWHGYHHGHRGYWGGSGLCGWHNGVFYSC
ncbi:MAG: hypothetical protein H0X26_05465 [Alphaproteobacteria bacterium]|nr:hypothetical protein [Alphaproteobacteria bacterium]